ncbi:hypothetical protein [Dehalogenimonas formicexedens]|uniref:Uncharacterized protein n=2 Tax=Dehalogenimonas TaxID=670486 RepID=A0A1P8F9C2_9CHLR|nr:hypothetical protein [Dehalogenimonas formicexedens]APV45069.1 hypothetical protein Dform_01750 [Dehalogenimonas formicexedens]
MKEQRIPELGEHADRGFRLENLDDHMVALYHEDEELGVFSQIGATAESIQKECARHLTARHGGEGIEKTE